MAMSQYSPFADAPLSQALTQDAARLSPKLSDAIQQQARLHAWSLTCQELTLDVSRQRIDAKALGNLLRLAQRAQLSQRIAELMQGASVNVTEQRPALHTALRADRAQPIWVNGVDITEWVQAERAKVNAYVAGIHQGSIVSSTQEAFTDVVNIGIGGSDLGPVMVSEALKSFARATPRVHFVSAIDGVQWHDLAQQLNPRTTLVIICSKTFSTIETLTNAHLARQWLLEHLGSSALAHHLAAVSTNESAMDAFGIGAKARFQLWDWVGGRYSVWSAIGLSAQLVLGTAAFEQLLLGARAMDVHFSHTPLPQNLPVMAGLLSFWNRVVLNIPTRAILPYDQRLHRLPAYLQQLTMESNGKHVRRQGQPVSGPTGAIYWGEPGNNGQHSFFQLLHQGTDVVAVDMLFPIRSSVGLQASQRLAIANALAQAEALCFGFSETQACAELIAKGLDAATAQALARHKVHPGGRPVSLLWFERLTPFVLGQLIAYYEHQVYVESVLMDINPFDQWGVELGKHMAVNLAPALAGQSDATLRPDMAELLKQFRAKGV
jgi:glucose-6-phosphate isomerase